MVLDEAYIEFSGQPSRLGWPARHDNLVVLRTFSKSAGLAGEGAPPAPSRAGRRQTRTAVM